MRVLTFLIIFFGFTASALAQRMPLGVYFEWGAFEEKSPRRCFAIAKPYATSGGKEAQPYVSISFWPRRGVNGQFYIRLSGKKRPSSAIILKIGSRHWQLIGKDENVWAPHAQADAEIMAAIRSGIEMLVETRAERGRVIRDSYRLRGAASAIDAAAVACADVN